MGLGARQGVPAGSDRHLLRNVDAQPAARAQGSKARRHRHRRTGGLFPPRARHPDLSRLFVPGPLEGRHPPPQRTARSPLADERRPRPHRCVRHGSNSALRKRGARSRSPTDRRHGAGNCRQPAFLLRQRQARTEGKANLRRGDEEGRRFDPDLSVLRPLPRNAGLRQAQHGDRRGLCGGAIARAIPQDRRPHEELWRRFRASRHGLAWRHHLHRGEGIGTHADLRPHRRHGRRALCR